MYKLLNKYDDDRKVIGTADCILRLADNAWIPFASDNTDYQQYLKWLDEGNTPEPAETTE